jgi:hypothetical protein
VAAAGHRNFFGRHSRSSTRDKAAASEDTAVAAAAGKRSSYKMSNGNTGSGWKKECDSVWNLNSNSRSNNNSSCNNNSSWGQSQSQQSLSWSREDTKKAKDTWGNLAQTDTASNNSWSRKFPI